MSKEDLIPANTRPREEHIAISRKGGLSKSKAKSEGQKWLAIRNRIKKGTMNTEDSNWMLEKLQSREAMSFDIMMYVEEIKKTCHPSQRIALANTMKDLARFTHGDKSKTENVNINVNVTVEEWEKRLMGDKQSEEK